MFAARLPAVAALWVAVCLAVVLRPSIRRSACIFSQLTKSALHSKDKFSCPPWPTECRHALLAFAVQAFLRHLSHCRILSSCFLFCLFMSVHFPFGVHPMKRLLSIEPKPPKKPCAITYVTRVNRQAWRRPTSLPYRNKSAITIHLPTSPIATHAGTSC